MAAQRAAHGYTPLDTTGDPGAVTSGNVGQDFTTEKGINAKVAGLKAAADAGMQGTVQPVPGWQTALRANDPTDPKSPNYNPSIGHGKVVGGRASRKK